jgi:hypothetical protein
VRRKKKEVRRKKRVVGDPFSRRVAVVEIYSIPESLPFLLRIDSITEYL